MTATGNYYLDTYGVPDVAAPPPSALPEETPAAKKESSGNYYLDRYGVPEYEAPPPPAADEGDYGWGITQAFKRGAEMLTALPDIGQGDYEELAGHFERLEQLGRSDEDLQKLRELQATEGWWDATAYYLKNPRLIGQIIAESLPNMAAPVAGAAVGGVAGSVAAGPPGAAAGVIAGAGLGSFSTEYLHSVAEFFERQGVNMADPDQLKAAFADPELMAGAREHGIKRGIPVAAFDALSFGIAGKLYRPGSAAVKTATGTAEVGAQAGAGMAGEAGAQVLAEGGIVDRPGIVAEGLAEIPGAIVEPVVNKAVGAWRERADNDALSDQLERDVPDDELDAMADIEVSETDVDAEGRVVVRPGMDALDRQASAANRTRIQQRQYAEMDRLARQKREAATLAEVEAEALLRDNERRSDAFIRAEADRDAALERQRREAEYQRELQRGEEAEQIAPYEAPGSAPAAEPARIVTGERLPNTAIAEAYRAAQAKKQAETAQREAAERERVETEGREVPPEPLVAPVRPDVPKPTRKPNYERDSFLTTRAKLPAGERLSQQAFEAEGLDVAALRQPVYKGRPAFSRHPNALKPDDVAEYLNQTGFPPPAGKTSWDANSALEAVIEEVEGRKPLLTGTGIEIAATEQEFADAQTEYERAVERRERLGPPKIRELEIDGETARVVEESDGSIEVQVGGRSAVVERKEGETNADLVRAVMAAQQQNEATKKKTEPTYAAKDRRDGDLFGQDTRREQQLADTMAAKDKKRNTGQDDLETGDPSDMFSAARQQVDLEDAAAAQETDQEMAAREDAEERAAIQEESEAVVEDETDEVIPGFDEEIATAANEAQTSPANDLPTPTKAQKEAGNYKKGHVRVAGLDVTIENPKGSSRRSVKLKDHYGYIRRTEGTDGDQVDVFISPEVKQLDTVYVIDQTKEDGVTFDEHKVMLGYANQLDAVRGYKRNYARGWKVGPVTKMTMAEFKAWLTQDTTKPAEKKPSRHARKYVRTQKGVRFSLQQSKKAVLEDARKNVPGANVEFLQAVLGQNYGQDTGMENALVTRALELNERTNVEPSQTRKEVIAEIEKVVADLQEKFPGANIVLVDNIKGTPKDVQKEFQQFDEADQLNIPGIYDIGNNKIYLFMDNIRSVEDVIATVLHELAHNGLRNLFPDSVVFGKVLTDIFQGMNQEQRAGVRDIAERYKLDMNKKSDRLEVIEEYIAIQAETNPESGIVKKMIAAVRRVLRKLGLVKGWSDNDIAALIAEAHGTLARTSESGDQITMSSLSGKQGAVAPPTPIRFRIEDEFVERMVDAHPENPVSQVNKIGAVIADIEDQPRTTRQIIDDIKSNPKDLSRRATLAAVPQSKLGEFIRNAMYGVQDYIRKIKRMDGFINERLEAQAETGGIWRDMIRKQPEVAKRLGGIMHWSSLKQTDPSKPFKLPAAFPKMPKEQKRIWMDRKRSHVILKKEWDQLPQEAKDLYVTVRDSYTNMRTEVLQALEKRIQETEADSAAKAKLIAELRRRFEQGKIEPYFPLSRFGKHMATAVDRETGDVVAFIKREKRSERNRWIQDMRDLGYDAFASEEQATDFDNVKRIDPNFVAKVVTLTDSLPGGETLSNEIWQMYLRTIPEMSAQKHFITRQGRLGFATDALRAYGYYMFHGTHQLGKLHYGFQLQSDLDSIKQEAKELVRREDRIRNLIARKDLQAAHDVEIERPEYKKLYEKYKGTHQERMQKAMDKYLQQAAVDAPWAQPLADEMERRHEYNMNPSSSLWATRMTSLGFFWFLSTSPAAGVLNLTQTAIVGLPTLGARFGSMGKAAGELLRASRQLIGTRGALLNTLRGDERAAFEEFDRIGMFEKTRVRDLTGYAEQGQDFSSRWNTAINVASWIFHHTEKWNREVTALAAYRLARDKGRSHDAAIYEAEEMVEMSHFDYTNTNRPRFMQKDAARVVFLFRNYSLNMTYRLARDFRDGDLSSILTFGAVRNKNVDDEVKNEARKRFAGILGSTFMFAGLSGMPLAWLAHATIDLALGDDDEPFDSQAAMRAHLTDLYGEDVATFITKGAWDAFTGTTISNRASLNNLWIREVPDKLSGKEWVSHMLTEAAGPLMGIAANVAEGVENLRQGFVERGIEKLVPKFAADSLKAIRFATEGALNFDKDVIMAPDEFSSWSLAMQIAGFTPADLATRYEQQRAIKDYEAAITTRRAYLMNRLFLAAKNNDKREVREVMNLINQFNKKNPQIYIGADSIMSSAKVRADYDARTVDGTTVPKKLHYLHEKFRMVDKDEDK